MASQEIKRKRLSYVVYAGNVLAGVSGFGTNLIHGGTALASRLLDDLGFAEGRKYILDPVRAGLGTWYTTSAAMKVGAMITHPQEAVNLPTLISTVGDITLAWRMFTDTRYSRPRNTWKNFAKDCKRIIKYHGKKARNI